MSRDAMECIGLALVAVALATFGLWSWGQILGWWH